MSNPSEEPSLDSLLSALRADVVNVDSAARGRIHDRLSAGVLTQLFGSALLPAFIQKGWAKSATVAKTKAFAVAIALPAGIVVGASGHAWFAGQHPAHGSAALTATALPQAGQRAAPPNVPAGIAAAAPVQPPAPSAASGAQPATRPRAAASTSGAWRPLNRELSLLEKARTLLSEGKAEATLSLIVEHERRYPRSTLDQERRALHIKALVAANRMIEARARAVAFVRSYPNSTLRSSVEKSASSIP